VLVTGPTGSGKSTTLAAMVDYINDNEYGHILTVEDPIEFVHESKKLPGQPARGAPRHAGFAEALRSALREDPDIILVGEMRDLETIRLALTAAETGHLVFGTLHTTSARRPSTASSTCSRRRKNRWCARCCPSRCAPWSRRRCSRRRTAAGSRCAHEIMVARRPFVT
jgi:twitching motility protein PilT